MELKRHTGIVICGTCLIILGLYNIAPWGLAVIGTGIAGASNFGAFCLYSLTLNFLFIPIGVGMLLHKKWSQRSAIILSTWNIVFSIIYWIGAVAIDRKYGLATENMLRKYNANSINWDALLDNIIFAPVIPYLALIIYLIHPKVKDQLKPGGPNA